MLEIGKQVTYIRQVGDTTKEGTGILKGLGLGKDSRVTSLVRDGEVAFNTPAVCLNATDEFKAKFKAHIETVEALAKETDKRAQGIIDEANKQIVELENELLGFPIQEPEPAYEAPEPEAAETPTETLPAEPAPAEAVTHNVD